MSGYDIQYWFSDLWYDLTHLGTAPIGEVAFKLVVLFFGFLFAKAILGVLWRVLYIETLRHILEPIFKVVFFPFRLPWIIGRWFKRRSEEKRYQREREANERRYAEQQRQQQIDAARMQQEAEEQRIAEMIRLQNQSRIR